MPKFDPKIAFGPNAILRYPKRTRPENLKIVFPSDARNRRRTKDFARAYKLLTEVSGRAKSKYASKQKGEKFDPFGLGDKVDFARHLFWEDADFLKALVLLGLNPDLRENAKFPWWNQLAVDELSHKQTGDGALITARYRHSLQTQYHSSGVEIDEPPQNVSVSALLQTSDGYYAIALRGGEKFSNVYHVIASALGITESMTMCRQSVYSNYLENILRGETGVDGTRIKSAELLSRISDWTGTDPMYNFLIELNVDSGTLGRLLDSHRRSSSGPEKRTKYKRYDFVPTGSEHVVYFLKRFYVGLLDETKGRAEEDRKIVHPGATTLLSVLSEKDGPISVLSGVYEEGTH